MLGTPAAGGGGGWGFLFMDSVASGEAGRLGSLRWVICALAIAAAGVSIYLAMASGHPVGCGKGSGCEQVLSSRWSGVGPVPIGAFAAVAYVVLIGCMVMLGSAMRGTAAWIATAIATSIFGAAVWFVVLQLFVIKAICTYCMIDHGLGVVTAVLVLVSVKPPGAGVTRIGALGAGLLGVVAMIGAQAALPHASTLQRLSAKGNFDIIKWPERSIGVLDGSLRLEVTQEPMRGSLEATHILVCMFDYACPHCRRTHQYLVAATAHWPGELAFMALPCPLNASCNQHIQETEPRFTDSCELAKLALAVRRAKPLAFSTFDHWLFEPETPRTAVEARAEAERMVGKTELEAALAAPEIAATIARNTAAFGRSGTDRLPILLSPEIGGIAGRPDSREELHTLLQKELHLSGGGG